MHEPSRFFSAPALSALALAMTGVAVAAEYVVRHDDQGAIVRNISSDDQLEIETVVESDLTEDFRADLIEIVQDSTLAPLDSDTLRSTLFFRNANQADKPKFEAFVGTLLAKRKRHEEALAVLAGLSPEQRIEHGASFSFAQSYRGAGNIEAAIRAYAMHIAANPNHNPGYVNYGILLAETDQHEEAVRVFARSVEITSSSRKGKSLSLLGQSQVALGLYEDAIASFDKSIQFRPDSGPTWRRFATAKARSGLYPRQEISADYGRALALSPDDATTMAEWAEYEFSIGRFETALPVFRKASAEAGKDFDILFSRTLNLLASERPRAARSIVRRMANVEMSSDQALLLNALQEASGIIRPPTLETATQACDRSAESERSAYLCVLLQLELENYDSALLVAEVLPTASLYALPAQFALARYDQRQGNPETALERLSTLLNKNPDSPLFWLYRARSLAALAPDDAVRDAAAEVTLPEIELSDGDEPIEDETLYAFQRALELNPESRKISLELSDYLLETEQFEAAETVLAAYAALNPNDILALTSLVQVYEAAGELQKAEETLLQLTRSSEENTETAQLLVAVQVSLEKYADALETADNLLDREPANTAVRKLRVQALEALDQPEEAAKERDRIRRLEPDAVSDRPEIASSTEFADAAAP
ncbi:MAG: tetratricopeptide repeat protein [Pseudomonadota bacterium]